MRSPLGSRARAEVVAVPAPGHHHGEGVAVDARVRAWLFGINLLRVTADVVLMPAAVRPVDDIDLERPRRLADNSPARRTPTRALPPPTGDGRPRLQDALQLLRDTDALLERASRSA